MCRFLCIHSLFCTFFCFFFFLMIRRPPRSTRLTHSFPTRRSSDLQCHACDIAIVFAGLIRAAQQDVRSEEHTSELQSLMRISYAVFCLKKKKKTQTKKPRSRHI